MFTEYQSFSNDYPNYEYTENYCRTIVRGRKTNRIVVAKIVEIMNLRVVVLPAKVLADGTHRVRIAISHKGQTRYFLTRFIVPSPDNIVSGQVVGVNNASYINQQLRIRMSKIYSICDAAEDIEYFTCSQLVQYIEGTEEKNVPKTIHDIGERFLTTRKNMYKEGTFKLYRDAITYFEMFFGSDYLLQLLTSDDLHRFELFLKEKRGLSQTTISIKMRNIHTVINYAVRQKFVKFDVSPYSDYEEPQPTRRNCAITLEKLRKIRDVDLSRERGTQIGNARDIFMLSFYLCGMNLQDIMAQDFRKKSVRFMRIKTETRKKVPTYTEFTIQPEARAILDRLTKNGKLFIGHERSCNAIQRILYDCLPRVAKLCGIDTDFIYYSARKTFAQLANQLFIKDSIIEYCIGDTVTQSRRVIGYYIQVTQQMADLAIRKVFDAVASDKTLEQLQIDALSSTHDRDVGME